MVLNFAVIINFARLELQFNLFDVEENQYDFFVPQYGKHYLMNQNLRIDSTYKII